MSNQNIIIDLSIFLLVHLLEKLSIIELEVGVESGAWSPGSGSMIIN